MSEEAFSPAQIAQLRQVLREEIGDAGLRLDGADHIDAAREDFRFVRKLRNFFEGTASKVGWAVMAAIVGGLIWIFSLGLNFWRGS